MDKKKLGKLIDGGFSLSKEPIDYQISFRLRQLGNYYGRGIFTNMVLQKPTKDKIADVHLNNLYGTYSYEKVLDVYKTMFVIEGVKSA